MAALLGRSNRAEAAAEAWTGSYADAVGIFTNTGSGPGVQGSSTDSGYGVLGGSPSGIGVKGQSTNGHGVVGHSWNHVGVEGSSDTSAGVVGSSTVLTVFPPTARWGVLGAGDDIGVAGSSTGGAGVKGLGKPGVYGVCYMDGGAGVRGDGEAPGSVGVFAKNTPGRQALRTEGQVQMNCARKVTLSNRANTVTLPTGV